MDPEPVKPWIIDIKIIAKADVEIEAIKNLALVDFGHRILFWERIGLATDPAVIILRFQLIGIEASQAVILGRSKAGLTLAHCRGVTFKLTLV